MKLILTFDYELYGDGSGNVFKHIIEPTDTILKICDDNRLKTTIFFEVLEYIKLKNEWETGNKMGYQKNPIEAIESQLRKAALKGHDIQLHVHPQWVNATFSENIWQVDLSNWRLGGFCVPQDFTIEDMLREAKETIESIIKPVIHNYECTILRAGGYNILPSEKVYNAMVNLGLKVDSSVYPGGHETGTLSRYDFRKAPIDKDYWLADQHDFSLETSESEVLEIPIFALPQKRLRKINIARIKSFIQNRNSAAESIKSKTGKKSLLKKIKFLFEKEAFTWDFCLFDYNLHISFLNYIDKKLKGQRSFFVIIGHPKSFTSGKVFEKFITESKRRGYKFKTLITIYDGIK